MNEMRYNPMRLLFVPLAVLTVVSAVNCTAEDGETAVVEEATTVVEMEAPREAQEPEPRDEPRVTEYTVVAGDNLGRIAHEHTCTVRQLRRANDLSGDLIHPGDRLIIPDCAVEEESGPSIAADSDYTIRSGDYLQLIAENAGCTTDQLMTANGMHSDAIFAGHHLRIPDCSIEVLPPEPEVTREQGAPSADVPMDESEFLALEGGAPEEEQSTEEGGGDVPGEEGAPEAPDRPELADGIYVVVGGDTLGRIGETFGCSVGEVMAENHLSNDRIGVGQSLVIPDDCTGEAVEIIPVSRVRTGGRDTETLRNLMSERGFDPPRRFKAMVLAIDFNAGRTEVVNEQLFDYRGTSDDTDWNPASTVKLFAAIAAMQSIRDLGFTGEARITFDGGHETTLDELVAEALGPSNNIAYDFLVTFVGYDELNGSFFSRHNGFHNTALRRAYERSRWMDMGFSSSFRASPEIVIREGGRTHTIPARDGDVDVDCSSSACTTLQDLAECMRRLMLQEQLPASDDYDLPRSELMTIRSTLRSLGRSRGEEVVDALRDSFPGAGVNLYHKAGFSNDWYSDTVYIYDPQRYPRQAWIVALAGYPGRDSLTEAATLIGELIAEGHL